MLFVTESIHNVNREAFFLLFSLVYVHCVFYGFDSAESAACMLEYNGLMDQDFQGRFWVVTSFGISVVIFV